MYISMYISIYPIAIDTKKDRETEHKSLSKTCKEEREREVEEIYKKRQEDASVALFIQVLLVYFSFFSSFWKGQMLFILLLFIYLKIQGGVDYARYACLWNLDTRSFFVL